MAIPRSSLDPRLPVLVGLGAASSSAPVADLMTEAVRAAVADAGAPGLLGAVDCLAVAQGTWSLTDPARTVARRIGSPRARTLRFEIGVSQQEMLNHALAAVAAGEHDTVVVMGGEARRWLRGGGEESDLEREPPDGVVERPPDFVAPIELEAGIVLPPVQQYALIENALSAARGLGPDAQRDEIAALWARFNAVAAHNPDAAFGAPRTAAEIAMPGPRNRPLAYPYNVWHASQWTVDQSSALVICSAARAAEAGVPPDRWLFPHVALHCSKAITLTARRTLAAWPAMAVLGRAAEHHAGRPLRDLGLAEVYSCFPAAVRVQQHELGLDPTLTPTLTGGMTFAGGPFNHFVLQSLLTLGSRLRAQPDELGLVTTVSGMLSKPGLALWSATPPTPGRPPLVADLADQAIAATGVVPVVETAPATATPARVASFTVTYGGADGLAAVRTAIVADLPDGVRTAATCEDADTARLAVAEGLTGRAVEVKDTSFSL
ncbi:MAG: acetyl-CoA acetyltransferase [Acidimicrobiales bacterium]